MEAVASSGPVSPESSAENVTYAASPSSDRASTVRAMRR
jgi:hypothetical protein